MTNSILLVRRSVLNAVFTLASALLIGGMAAPSIQAGDLLPYKGTVEGVTLIDIDLNSPSFSASFTSIADLIASHTGKGIQESSGDLILDAKFCIQANGTSVTTAANGEVVFVEFLLQELVPTVVIADDGYPIISFPSPENPHPYVGTYRIYKLADNGTRIYGFGEGMIVGENYGIGYCHTFNGTIAKSVLKTQPAKKK